MASYMFCTLVLISRDSVKPAPCTQHSPVHSRASSVEETDLTPEVVLSDGVIHPAVSLQQGASCRLHGLP